MKESNTRKVFFYLPLFHIYLLLIALLLGGEIMRCVYFTIYPYKSYKCILNNYLIEEH